MDEKLIEGMRRMNQIGAWETYGKDAIAVVSQGTPGETQITRLSRNMKQRDIS